MNAKPLRSARCVWWTRTRAFAIHFECLFNTDQPFNCWNETLQIPRTVALSSTIRLQTRIWALAELTISLHESLYAQWQSFDPHHFDCWMWDTHTHTRTVRGISALSQGTLLHWIGVVGSNKIHLLKYSTGILCYLSVTYSKYSVLYYIILLLHCKLRDIYLMMLATLQIQINNTKYIFRM